MDILNSNLMPWAFTQFLKFLTFSDSEILIPNAMRDRQTERQTDTHTCTRTRTRTHTHTHTHGAEGGREKEIQNYNLYYYQQ
jgi:hypothetical protein